MALVVCLNMYIQQVNKSSPQICRSKIFLAESTNSSFGNPEVLTFICNGSSTNKSCVCSEAFSSPSCQLRNGCTRVEVCIGRVCLCLIYDCGGGACNCSRCPGFVAKFCDVSDSIITDPYLNGSKCSYDAGTMKHRCLCSDRFVGQRFEDPSPCISRSCGAAEPTSCRCLGFFCVHECSPCCRKSISCANQNGIGDSSQGYKGRLLCGELNHCLKDLDKNVKSCYSAKSSVRCHCKTPQHDQFCQHVDPCLPNPCQGGGKFLTKTRSKINETRLKIRTAKDFQFKGADGNGYSCRCKVPYRGSRCQCIDLCQRSNPCLNRGKCESSGDGQLVCRCSSRFFGDHCQHSNPCQRGSCPFGTRCYATSPTNFVCAENELRTNLDDIALSDEPQCPCQNGGSCIELSQESRSPTFHSLKCNCIEGFTGELCEMREELKSCLNQPCLNGGICKLASNHLKPSHSKHPPSRPHQQSNEGQSSPENHSCHCDSEHQGPFCEEEIPCNDSDKKCYNDGECVKNQFGFFRCNCSEGYSGLKCQSFNPCLLHDTCNHRGKCVVAKTGMYQCLCQVGFKGQHCEIHNPCLEPQICLNNGTCANDIGGDICHCSDGFAGLRCELNLSNCNRVRCESGGKCYDHRGVVDCNCHGESCSTDDKTHIHADHGLVNVSFACPAEDTLRSRGFYQWPATLANTRASLKCQRNPDQIATRVCFNDEDNNQPTWAEPNLSGCTRAVKTASEAVEALLPYTSRDSLDDVTMVNVMELLSDVLEITYSSQEVAILMLRAIDTILQRSENIRNNMTSQLLKLLERYSINCQCLRNGNFSLTLNNLEIYVASHDRQHVPFQLQQNHKLDLSFSTFDSETSERIAVVIFSTPKLFQGNQWRPKLLGDVVLWASSSASLATKGKGLVTPATCLVKFSFYSDQPSRNFRCAQWNTSTRTWTGDGVETLTLLDGSISCCSNGFFYLAVVDDEGLALISHIRSDVIMTIFSLMCFIVSISCNLVITVHFATSRCFNRMEYGQIMLQLCISMVMMDAGLILSYNQRMLRQWTQHFCSPISIFCNFFVTSTHTWFACLAQFTYGQVSSKSLSNERNNIGRRSLVSWGLALIQLLISATLNIYGFVPNSSKCWSEGVNWPALWTTLLIPVILCLCVSTVWCVASAWKSLPCYRFTYERPKYGGHEVGKVVDPEENFIPEPDAGTKFVIRKTEVFGYLALNILFIVSWIAFCLSTLDSLSSQSIVFLKSHCLLRALSGCLCLSIFLAITCRTRRDICCRKSKLQTHRVESISSSAASNSTFKQEEVQQHFAAIHSRFHHCAPPLLSSPPRSPTSSHPFPATSMSLIQTPVPSSTTVLTSLNIPTNCLVNAPLKLPTKPNMPSLGTFSTLPSKASESVKTYLPTKVVGFAKLSPPPSQQSSSSNHELQSCCSLSDKQTLRKKHTRV